MVNNLTQKTGVSLKSFSEQVKQTTWRVRLSSLKVSQLSGAWTKTYIASLKCGNKDANCYSPSRWLKLTRKSNVNIYYTDLESRVSNCSTARICLQTRKKKLESYWKRFEHFVKPHSNKLITAWELHNIRRGTLSLEEFILRLRVLVKKANYPVEHNDRFLRGFLVLGMNSDRVRKDCFKVGNAFMFNAAREMAKSEESAEKQLQLMNTEVHSINAPKGYQGLKNERQHPNSDSGKFASL